MPTSLIWPPPNHVLLRWTFDRYRLPPDDSPESICGIAGIQLIHSNLMPKDAAIHERDVEDVLLVTAQRWDRLLGMRRCSVKRLRDLPWGTESACPAAGIKFIPLEDRERPRRTEKAILAAELPLVFAEMKRRHEGWKLTWDRPISRAQGVEFLGASEDEFLLACEMARVDPDSLTSQQLRLLPDALDEIRYERGSPTDAPPAPPPAPVCAACEATIQPGGTCRCS